MLVQPDGKILVTGAFRNIGGQPREGLARLDPVTGLADSFNPSPGPGTIGPMALQADGKLLIIQPELRRVDPVTGLFDSFNAGRGYNGSVEGLAIAADGKILVGGYFQAIGGFRRKILRV